MFDFRLVTNEDYPKLVEAWKFWKFPAPGIHFLPQNKEGITGVMVTKDGQDICFGFIYFTNSKLAWCEYLCRVPEYREKDTDEALTQLIIQLCSIAERQGYQAVFTSLKNENLIKIYRSVGFISGSTSTTEMILNL